MMPTATLQILVHATGHEQENLRRGAAEGGLPRERVLAEHPARQLRQDPTPPGESEEQDK